MSKNKQLKQLEELQEFVKNSKKYTSTEEVINNYEILIKNYDCFCITDQDVRKQYLDFYSELKNKISEKKIDGGKRKRKTKMIKYINKKTRKNQKGGNFELIYMCAALMVTAGIAVLTLGYNSSQNLLRENNERIDNDRINAEREREREDRMFQRYYADTLLVAKKDKERDDDLALPEHQRNNCSICFESLHNSDSVTKTPCGHSFHYDCLRSWKAGHNTCPICRARL